MAQASTLRFSEFLIEIEDPDATGTFVAPCGLNSRSFNRSAQTNDTNVPDCDDPDAASWLERDIVSLSAQISGAGVVADEDFDTWDEWYEAGESRRCRVTLGARTWLGSYKLSGLNVTGNRGNRTTFDATLLSDGEVARQ